MLDLISVKVGGRCMNYSLELNKMSIETYRELLRNQVLLPSRKYLQDDLDENFEGIRNLGINDLGELKKQLSTPKKLDECATKSGIPKDYLVLLKREIGSIQPNIIPINEFPGFRVEIIGQLVDLGVKSSKDYFEFYARFMDIQELVSIVPMTLDEAKELFCLCNLVRINGVGAVAAKSFYDAGYISVQDVSSASAEKLLEKVLAVNARKHLYQAKLGVKDMQFCIDAARMIERFEDKSV